MLKGKVNNIEFEIKYNQEWEILTPSGWSDFESIKTSHVRALSLVKYILLSFPAAINIPESYSYDKTFVFSIRLSIL